MRTTIEISDNLLLRAKALARERNITLRSLIEESLAAALGCPTLPAPIRPVISKGKGVSPNFEAGSWEKIRDAIYS